MSGRASSWLAMVSVENFHRSAWAPSASYRYARRTSINYDTAVHSPTSRLCRVPVPLPEAKDFQIQQRQKGAATAAMRSGKSSRDYTRYDLTIGDQTLTRMSKQAAVKTAIQELHRAGVSLAPIKSVTLEKRWVAVHPAASETVEDAFRREYPFRSPSHLWYDLGISEGDTTWVIPRFGGRDTEQILNGLASIAPPHTTLTWSASDASPTADEDAQSRAHPAAQPP